MSSNLNCIREQLLPRLSFHCYPRRRGVLGKQSLELHVSASDESLDLFGKLRISKHLVDHFRFHESASYALEPLFRLLWLRRAHFQIRQLREAPHYFLCHHAGQQRIELKIALLLAIAVLVQALFESRLKTAQHPLTDCAMKPFQRSRAVDLLTISALSWPLQFLK